jgi:hypothetical protein
MQKLFVYFLIVLITVGCATHESGKNTRLPAEARFSTTSPISPHNNRTESDLFNPARVNLPDSILPELKKYPVDTFFFDIGIERGSDDKAFKNAVVKAQAKASQRIIQRVQGIIRSNISELQHDMVLEHYSTVLEHYKPINQNWTVLKLEEVFNVRNLSVDLALTDWNTYAFIYIKRDELKQLYSKRALELRSRINQILARAQVAEKAYDIEGAVKEYLSTYPLYEKLKEAEIIQLGVEYAPDLKDAFTNLANAVMGGSGNSLTSHTKVIKRVEELEREPITSVEDVASVVKSQLSRQVRNKSDIRVLINPFTYEDSMMISHFSRELHDALQQQVEWHSADRMRGFMKKNETEPLQFSGSYWENGNEITVRATLRNVNTGEFWASTVVRFLGTQLRPATAFKPPNYQQAEIEKDAFAPQDYGTRPRNSTPKALPEDKLTPIGELKVEVHTDKGSSPLYYTEGETMTVFGRVNQPAYLRLLYILSDGKRTLLQDNYYIGPSQVNSSVEIGEFVCTPPFGTELLIAAARTEKFPPIKTYKENGYVFLVDQDAELAAQSFRGMQRIPDKTTEQQNLSFQQSEAQLVLTTIEK